MNITNLILKTFERPELASTYLDADAQQAAALEHRPKACIEVICA